MTEELFQVSLEGTNQHSGQYTLTFNSSQYPVTLNPERNITVSEWLRRIRPVLVGDKDPARDIDPQDLLRNVGTWLWRALLPESAPARERETLARALRTGRAPLLLALPDPLAGLPWELLCDPEQSGERGFLAHRRPLMRFCSSVTPVIPIEPPLRVLLLISSPPSLGEDSRIDVESERAAVEHAVYDMRQAGLLHLLVEDIVTPKRVQHLLVRFKPHIVHYIGHGEYNETSGGVLLWEDEQGNELPLSASRLANLLRPRNLHAVVLHACQTSRSNVQTDMNSIVGTLVTEGISAVLAQQANFTYESSQRASDAWYTALTAGQSIASALFEVRQALTQADRPDWAVPILQGNTASLAPLLNATSFPGVADPLLTSTGAATDFPAPTSIFVGRHRELRDLRLMLENVPGSGPVMALITGPGGVGKSTLLAQAVTRFGRTYKAALTLRCEGYQSVELFLKDIGEFLSGLQMPSFLEQCLPDPKLSTEAKIKAAIAALNATGPLLLVIDNLESVQNDDQTIREEALLYLLQKLLTNLRGGRVLITGRYAVKDLLPQGKFAANLLRLNLDDLSPYETNQLLMRHPTLARLGETARKKLVDEFGGLPYVYDLLSSEGASQSLDLLIHDVQGRITKARKQHTAQEWQEVRQQVIEFAALEVTVDRLSAASRMLLAQLGVLHRPFPLAAIEEGLGAEQPVWQSLLDWSLLHYDPQEQSYHLHSLTRRYVEGLLKEHDKKQAQVQLASWYEHYAGHESHNLADALEAHRLSRTAGNVQQAGRLVMQLAETLRRFGLYPLLRDLCAKTLNDIRESDELLAASALWELGTLAQFQGEYEEARSLYQQSLTIDERLGNPGGRAAVLHGLGTIAQEQGEYKQARALYQRSLDIKEQLGDQGGRAGSLYHLGIIAHLQGEYEKARVLYQQSMAIFEQLGDQHGRAAILHALGNLAQEQGEHEQAYAFYQQSLIIDERLGNQRGRANSLSQIGTIAQVQGIYEEAHAFYQQSIAIFERLGDQSGRAKILHRLGIIAELQGEYEQARTLYQQSLAIFEQLGDQSGRASSLRELGMIAQHQGEYGQAQALCKQSLAIFEQLGDQRGRASSLGELGVIAQHQGEYGQAHNLYQQSLTISENLGDQSGKAKALHQLGMIAQEQGEYEEARTLYQQSLDIKEQLGDQRGRANSLYQLGTIAQDQGEYEEARTLYQQSLDIKEQLGDQSGQASSLRELGMIAQDQGEYEQARTLYQRSLDIFEQLGDQNGQANSLYRMGTVAQEQGKYEQAHALYQQSLAFFEHLGDQPGRAKILHGLGMIAQRQGEYEEARTLYQQSLDIFEQLGDQSRQAEIQHRLGIIAHLQREYEKARSHYQQSLNITERLGNETGQASSLRELGVIAYLQGEYEKARSHYQRCLDITERLRDQSGQAKILHLLGNLALEQGEYEEARALYQQSLDIFEQLGDQSGRANSLHHLGVIAQEQREYEQGRALYQQSLTIFENLGDQSGKAKTLHHLGMIAQEQGEYEQACSHYQRCLDIFEHLGDQNGQANSLYRMGIIAQEQGKYEQAYALYQQSLAFFEHLGDRSGQANSLLMLGIIALEQGEYEEARALYQQSLDISEQLGDQSGRANSLHHLGIIAQRQGEYEQAHDLYQQSLAIKERLGEHLGRANSLHQLGIIAQRQGDYKQAHDLYQQSLAIRERLGDQNGRADSLHQLGNLVYLQGNYEEAHDLYQQSLAIRERLGNQRGRAGSLYQLGALAYEQGNFEHALTYMIQAYILFEALQSPSLALTHDIITRIRSNIDEETFITQWRTLAGHHPFPTLAAEDTQQTLLQLIIDFIRAPTWSESKRFLETHPELLQPEIDRLLQTFAAQQGQDSVRKTIEEHRLLLAQCRDQGVDTAFAELQVAQSSEVAFAANLNLLCNEVVVMLRTGNTEQRKALATRIEQMLKNSLPMEGVQNFLMVLLAWLRDQDAHSLAEKLPFPFHETYVQMVAAVEEEEAQDTNEDNIQRFEQLPNVVSSVILYGTTRQRQQYAAVLIEVQQQLPPESAPLGRFLGCLIAALLGETPEAALLEEPYAELWQEFLDALSSPPDESSQEEGGKHD